MHNYIYISMVNSQLFSHIKKYAMPFKGHLGMYNKLLNSTVDLYGHFLKISWHLQIISPYY